MFNKASCKDPKRKILALPSTKTQLFRNNTRIKAFKDLVRQVFC